MRLHINVTATVAKDCGALYIPECATWIFKRSQQVSGYMHKKEKEPKGSTDTRSMETIRDVLDQPARDRRFGTLGGATLEYSNILPVILKYDRHGFCPRRSTGNCARPKAQLVFGTILRLASREGRHEIS